MAKESKYTTHRKAVECEVIDCEVYPTFERIKVVSEELDKHGRKVRKVEWKEQPLCERDKGLKWTDFSIDSLSMSGALANASFSTLSGNNLDIVDNLPDGADDVQSMVNDVAAVNSTVEENNDKNIEE